MRRWIVIGAVAAVVVAGGVTWAVSSGSGSGSRPLLITATAQPRDLRDEVTVQGTVKRAEQLTVNSVSTAPATGNAGAAGGSTVSAVYLKDGTTLATGQSILAVDGRDSVTVRGAFPFFRRLDVGAQGADVLQLERVLAAAGYSPGALDGRYTEQTRFALAQWQAAHGYPGAAPSVNQSVNVQLQQGSGYKLGDQTSAGLTITPPAGTAAARRASSGPSSTGARVVTVAARRGGVSAQSCATPGLAVQATATQVAKGAAAAFVVSADCAPSAATPFTVAVTAGAGAVIVPAGPFTLAAGATSTTVQVQTIGNNLVEPDQTLTVELTGGAGYTVGSPASASTTIVSGTVPQLTLSGSATVQAGQSATITVTADQAPVQDTQVVLVVGGTAQVGSDYTAFAPNVVLPAGQTTVSFSVSTRTTSTVKPARTIVVSLASSGAYKVGPIGAATVTIAATSGNAAIPVVTIRAANLRVNAGQPAQFTVGLDRALSDPLALTLSYGGDAVAGTDYNPASGVLVVQPGQTTLTVAVPTLDNGRVAGDRLLTVTVEPASGYVVGDPASASATIVNATLPKLSIRGSTTSVGAGGGAVFTIVADQAPVKDISVQYTVTGTAQQGRDLQPVTGSVTVAAGATSVDVTVLTLNTNVYFVPTDMIAIGGPTRLGQVLVKDGQIIAAGTPLFSLTEPNLTVSISISAADRTKLKVGQSVTVQVQGGDQSAPGLVNQLDDFITTDKQTQKQTYQGSVQVRSDLGAADGTPVTVNVIVQDRTGALTVPIAAVKQNGAGRDVVRVIDLANGGTIREVEVTTGLTQGSYIEIKSGLRQSDVVVVELDHQGG